MKTSELTEADEWWVDRQIQDGNIQELLQWGAERGSPESWKTAVHWTSRPGRTIAGRLLNLGGDSRGSHAVQWMNFRENPDDPTATYFAAFRYHQRFGGLRAIRMIEKWLEEHPGTMQDSQTQAHGIGSLCAYLGCLYGNFRDFERATACLDRADGFCADDPWFTVLRSDVLTSEDRNEEALEVAERAMALAPNYRSAIGSVADLYWTFNRDDEAFALLTDASSTRNDGAALCSQLAGFYDETEQYEIGLTTLDEHDRRLPFPDKAMRKWSAGLRASLLYMLGRGEAMVPFAETSERTFYTDIAKRVESGEFAAGQRVRLPVGFVRQHDMTCAPATLTALAGYWGREADHLEIAEEICYDGTPAHKERLWAEQQGYHVTEFRADWDTTRALIDVGVPFSLATVEETSAHLQALVGYDTRANTVIIRDPGHRHYSETKADHFFEEYAGSGPRALLFLPKEEVHRIASIDLPEESLYDEYHVMMGALETHDREAAADALERLKKKAGGETEPRLALYGDWSIAAYDDDQRAALTAVEKLAAQFPKDRRLQFARFHRAANFEPREVRVAYVRDQLKQEKVSSLFYKELAELLSRDSRTLPEAVYSYRRALRFRPYDAEVFHGQAGGLWEMREFEEATELYRLAFCLANRAEWAANSYFKACRFLKRTDEALDQLHRRFAKHGPKSSGPALTLCRALSLLDRDAEVPPILDRALEWQPDDAPLLAFAGAEYAMRHDIETAEALLERLRDHASVSEVARLEARIATYASRPADALAAWRSILEREPLAMDARNRVASLTAEIDGTEATIESLQTACAEFPHHIPLHSLLIEWQREKGPGHAEPTLRHLIEQHPTHGWARRELTLELSSQGRDEEALVEAETNLEMQPNETFSHSIRGLIHEELDQAEAAHADFRAALMIDAENRSALSGLIRTAGVSEKRREAIAFIESQFAGQTLFGEAMLTFRDIAFTVLEPEALLASLHRIHDARPDLWSTWSALSLQLIEMNRPEEAIEYARGLTERFPLMPRGWLDLAEAHREAGQMDEEIAMLEKCLEVNPQWDIALRQLGIAKESRGELEEARELFTRALAENPRNAVNQGYLGDLEWRLGNPEAAFDHLLGAVRSDASYSWAWGRVADLAKTLDRGEEAVAEASRFVENEPKNSDAWTRLANYRGRFEDEEARLSVLDEAIAELPSDADLYNYKAQLLSEAYRFEEAIAATQAGPWETRPYWLAGREAWVEAQRGNRPRAIELMQAIVAEQEDYYWGHQELSEWLLAEERYEEALASAKQLVRLSPRHAIAHGFVADVLRKQGGIEREKEAMESLERAFEIDPTYTYAGYNLIEYRLGEDRLDDAETLLDRYHYYNPDNSGVAELRVNLARRRKDPEAAVAAFSTLCRVRAVSEGTLQRAEASLDKAGQQDRTTELYYDALASGEVFSPEVGARWAAWANLKNPMKAAKHLKALDLRPDVAEETWRELLQSLSTDDKHFAAMRLFREHRDVYATHTDLWAAAAWSIRMAKKYREVVKWMGDWREREGVSCWMLLNLARATFETSGLAAAGEIHLAAATELPPDNETYAHFAAAAFSSVLAGDFAETQARLEASEPGVLPPAYLMLYRLSEALIEVTEDSKSAKAKYLAALEAYPDWRDDRWTRVCVHKASGRLLRRTFSGKALVSWINSFFG